jgi:hypothetical protein
MRWRSPLVAGVEIGAAGAFGVAEVAEQHLGVGVLEIVARVFLLGLQETRRRR